MPGKNNTVRWDSFQSLYTEEYSMRGLTMTSHATETGI